MTLILGIETSCDETSAAVVKDGKIVLSNIVKTQMSHQEFGGVVPDLSSREHVEFIYQVIQDALDKASVSIKEIDAVSAVNGPGLIGSLMVGLMAAKGIALRHDKKLIATDHVKGHLYGNMLSHDKLSFPSLGLVVSGGHTSLFIVNEDFSTREVGKTLDDAAGEAFDKCAKMLSLGYPGGPALEKAAYQKNCRYKKFPVAKLNSLDFSFSGLKTAVMYFLRETEESVVEEHRGDIAASVEDAIVSQLINTAKKAFDIYKTKSVMVAGGVSANRMLRARFKETFEKRKTEVFVPEMKYCTDNAALTAGLAYTYWIKNIFSPIDVGVYSRN
ncbi:MAG: tRNA (adenosine(37)-N6)-threonylcarbamoyltransferase complex transferase subunit TsaD [bacterium]|nr:tRNA (adenosine(37)-N6)-threonylcarbamoyltransferase complex transferase subunit TsaD [bacterium]